MAYDDIMIGDISMEGFQVVRSQYFCRQIDPVMNIWERAIAFNVPAYSALNNCESVQILVNMQDKRILVNPSHSKEPDSINWIRTPADPKTTRLECSLFTRQLFEKWGWDGENRYRTNGKLVKFDKKLLLLFDFSHPETWKGTKMVKDRV